MSSLIALWSILWFCLCSWIFRVTIWSVSWHATLSLRLFAQWPRVFFPVGCFTLASCLRSWCAWIVRKLWTCWLSTRVVLFGISNLDWQLLLSHRWIRLSCSREVFPVFVHSYQTATATTPTCTIMNDIVYCGMRKWNIIFYNVQLPLVHSTSMIQCGRVELNCGCFIWKGALHSSWGRNTYSFACRACLWYRDCATIRFQEMLSIDMLQKSGDPLLFWLYRHHIF